MVVAPRLSLPRPGRGILLDHHLGGVGLQEWSRSPTVASDRLRGAGVAGQDVPEVLVDVLRSPVCDRVEQGERLRPVFGRGVAAECVRRSGAASRVEAAAGRARCSRSAVPLGGRGDDHLPVAELCAAGEAGAERELADESTAAAADHRAAAEPTAAAGTVRGAGFCAAAYAELPVFRAEVGRASTAGALCAAAEQVGSRSAVQAASRIPILLRYDVTAPAATSADDDSVLEDA